MYVAYKKISLVVVVEYSVPLAHSAESREVEACSLFLHSSRQVEVKSVVN